MKDTTVLEARTRRIPRAAAVALLVAPITLAFVLTAGTWLRASQSQHRAASLEDVIVQLQSRLTAAEKRIEANEQARPRLAWGIAAVGAEARGTDGMPWSLNQSSGPRNGRFRVDFEKGTFKSPPQVLVSLAGFDQTHDGGRGLRLYVRVVQVTPEGFEYMLHTWGDSIVTRADVAWLAYTP